MEIKRALIEVVNIKDPKSGSKNGKDWKLWNAGIKVNGEWHNTTLWTEEDVEKLKGMEGKTTDLYFFKEQYNGTEYDKFRIPKQVELMDIRVSRMEAFSMLVMEHFPELKEPFLQTIK